VDINVKTTKEEDKTKTKRKELKAVVKLIGIVFLVMSCLAPLYQQLHDDITQSLAE
jgi:hypothetical protein